MHSVTVGSKKSRRRSSIAAAVLLVLLAVGLMLILLRPELPIGWLPLLIILLCPLMHMFMHRRHGGHGSSATAGDEQAQRSRHF